MPPLPKSQVLDYVVQRTTTDKLQETLNGMALYFEELTPTYCGGRDWVVTGLRSADLSAEHTPYGNASKESREEAKTVRIA